MGQLIFDKIDLQAHLKEKVKEIGVEKMGEYYTQRIIRRYSKEEQDASLAAVIKTILEVPGGYWQIVDNMNFMPDFEHYKMRNVLSYEKGNVPKTIAAKELTIKQYQNIYK